MRPVHFRRGGDAGCLGRRVEADRFRHSPNSVHNAMAAVSSERANLLGSPQMHDTTHMSARALSL